MLKHLAAVLRWTANLLDPPPAPVKPFTYTAYINGSGTGTTVTHWPDAYTWTGNQ